MSEISSTPGPSPFSRLAAWALGIGSVSVLLGLMYGLNLAGLAIHYGHLEQQFVENLTASDHIGTIVKDPQMLPLLPPQDAQLRRVVQIALFLDERAVSRASELVNSLDQIRFPERIAISEKLAAGKSVDLQLKMLADQEKTALSRKRNLAALVDPGTTPPAELGEIETQLAQIATERESATQKLEQIAAETRGLVRSTLSRSASPLVSPYFVWAYSVAQKISCSLGHQLPTVRARLESNPSEVLVI